MTIEFKTACTPQEIDDALWLRHQVYVVEEGRYGGRPLPDERIVDRFDVIPKVAHILAYDDEEPIAGMRLNCDMGLGVPPEAHFDFRQYLPPVLQDSSTRPIVASAGMLTIRRDWRRRRDILPSLYRVAAGVFFSWDATHITATVSETTVSSYLRAGFQPISEPIWIEAIGDSIVPIVARADDCYRWAFGQQRAPNDAVWQERRRVSCQGCNAVAS